MNGTRRRGTPVASKTAFARAAATGAHAALPAKAVAKRDGLRFAYLRSRSDGASEFAVAVLRVPLLYVAFWLAFVDKISLGWRDIPRWQIYPLVYFTYVLGRGLLTGWYAYPFIDVSQLGFARVLLNAAGLVVVFGLSGALAVGIARAAASWRKREFLADTLK